MLQALVGHAAIASSLSGGVSDDPSGGLATAALADAVLQRNAAGLTPVDILLRGSGRVATRTLRAPADAPPGAPQHDARLSHALEYSTEAVVPGANAAVSAGATGDLFGSADGTGDAPNTWRHDYALTLLAATQAPHAHPDAAAWMASVLLALPGVREAWRQGEASRPARIDSLVAAASSSLLLTPTVEHHAYLAPLLPALAPTVRVLAVVCGAMPPVLLATPVGADRTPLLRLLQALGPLGVATRTHTTSEPMPRPAEPLEPLLGPVVPYLLPGDVATRLLRWCTSALAGGEGRLTRYRSSVEADDPHASAPVQLIRAALGSTARDAAFKMLSAQWLGGADDAVLKPLRAVEAAVEAGFAGAENFRAAFGFLDNLRLLLRLPESSPSARARRTEFTLECSRESVAALPRSTPHLLRYARASLAVSALQLLLCDPALAQRHVARYGSSGAALLVARGAARLPQLAPCVSTAAELLAESAARWAPSAAGDLVVRTQQLTSHITRRAAQLPAILELVSAPVADGPAPLALLCDTAVWQLTRGLTSSSRTHNNAVGSALALLRSGILSQPILPQLALVPGAAGARATVAMTLLDAALRSGETASGNGPPARIFAGLRAWLASPLPALPADAAVDEGVVGYEVRLRRAQLLTSLTADVPAGALAFDPTPADHTCSEVPAATLAQLWGGLVDAAAALGFDARRHLLRVLFAHTERLVGHNRDRTEFPTATFVAFVRTALAKGASFEEPGADDSVAQLRDDAGHGPVEAAALAAVARLSLASLPSDTAAVAAGAPPPTRGSQALVEHCAHGRQGDEAAAYKIEIQSALAALRSDPGFAAALDVPSRLKAGLQALVRGEDAVLTDTQLARLVEWAPASAPATTAAAASAPVQSHQPESVAAALAHLTGLSARAAAVQAQAQRGKGTNRPRLQAAADELDRELRAYRRDVLLPAVVRVLLYEEWRRAMVAELHEKVVRRIAKARAAADRDQERGATTAAPSPAQQRHQRLLAALRTLGGDVSRATNRLLTASEAVAEERRLARLRRARLGAPPPPPPPEPPLSAADLAAVDPCLFLLGGAGGAAWEAQLTPDCLRPLLAAPARRDAQPPVPSRHAVEYLRILHALVRGDWAPAAASPQSPPPPLLTQEVGVDLAGSLKNPQQVEALGGPDAARDRAGITLRVSRLASPGASGVRVLWETTVDYSEALSPVPSPDGIRRAFTEATAGRWAPVYTEQVRVWALLPPVPPGVTAAAGPTLTGDAAAAAAVDAATRSHAKSLKAATAVVALVCTQPQMTHGGRVAPGLWRWAGDGEAPAPGPKAAAVAAGGRRLHYVPARPGSDEYTLLKLYRLTPTVVAAVTARFRRGAAAASGSGGSTALVSHASTAGGGAAAAAAAAVDFPFLAREAEQFLVGLPDIGRMLLLIGRSGTGKTSVVSYRILRAMRAYWEAWHRAGGTSGGDAAMKAAPAGGSPLLAARRLMRLRPRLLTKLPGVAVDDGSLAAKAQLRIAEVRQCYHVLSRYNPELSLEGDATLRDVIAAFESDLRAFRAAVALAEGRDSGADAAATAADDDDVALPLLRDRRDHLHVLYVTRSPQLREAVAQYVAGMLRGEGCGYIDQGDDGADVFRYCDVLPPVEQDPAVIAAALADGCSCSSGGGAPLPRTGPWFLTTRVLAMVLDALLPGKPFFAAPATGATGGAAARGTAGAAGDRGGGAAGGAAARGTAAEREAALAASAFSGLPRAPESLEAAVRRSTLRDADLDVAPRDDDDKMMVDDTAVVAGDAPAAAPAVVAAAPAGSAAAAAVCSAPAGTASGGSAGTVHIPGLDDAAVRARFPNGEATEAVFVREWAQVCSDTRQEIERLRAVARSGASSAAASGASAAPPPLPEPADVAAGMRLPPQSALVELRSAIAGTDAAVVAPDGVLPLEAYLRLGDKATAVKGAGLRTFLWHAAGVWRRRVGALGMWSESDLVHAVVQRLLEHGYVHKCGGGSSASPPRLHPLAPLHQVVVDEAQDCTQAELLLIAFVAADPNAVQITGDTAQTIVSGVSFRFADVGATMYRAAAVAEEELLAQIAAGGVGGRASTALALQRGTTTGGSRLMEPPGFEQLTQNYRAHDGILRCASVFVSAVAHFAPNTIDRLQPDRGLLSGPKVKLVTSGDALELAQALKAVEGTGDGSIDFGAKQAIVVRNDAARASLPVELRAAPTYTTDGAKGLEFDDLVLYNPFHDGRRAYRVLLPLLDDPVAGGELLRGLGLAAPLPRPPELKAVHPEAFSPTEHLGFDTEWKVCVGGWSGGGSEFCTACSPSHTICYPHYLTPLPAPRLRAQPVHGHHARQDQRVGV